jgi:hypothetical protein
MIEKIMSYAHDIRSHATLIGIDVDELVKQAAQYYNISEEETDFYAVCEYIATKSEYNKYF